MLRVFGNYKPVVKGPDATSDVTFRVIKCQFGFTKVRYKGLAKNTAQLVTLFR